MLNIIFFPFLTSLAICLIFIIPTIKIAYKLKLIDDPNVHKHPAMIHKRIIPRAGGLPIFVAILISSIVFLPANNTFISIIFASFIVVMVGLLDDRYDLSPYFRFALNVLSASIVVFSGVDVPFISNPFGGILSFEPLFLNLFGVAIPFYASQILAILWIVWVMNMLNWSKGVDGQMPGIAATAAIIIGIASLRFFPLEQMNISVSQMSFIVSGASVGFLIFNFYPAKIHPGYSSTILGFLIAVLSILSSVKIATAVLVMGVPMTDAIITVLRRIFSKRSPFWHDKGHLHHLLLDLGLNQRMIALFYWGMSMFLGLIALSLSSKGKFFAIILVGVIVGGFILTLRKITKIRSMSNGMLVLEKEK